MKYSLNRQVDQTTEDSSDMCVFAYLDGIVYEILNFTPVEIEKQIFWNHFLLAGALQKLKCK